MLQVPCFKCLMFDAFSFQQDDFVAPKLDVGWRYAVEPLMTSLMIAVGDKYLNATHAGVTEAQVKAPAICS